MQKNFNFFIKIFFLKREPYYHKIQYSKVQKYDIAAAVFGIVIGAFVVYMALNTFGSGSPDLSDLSILFWYSFLMIKSAQLFIINQKYKSSLLFLFLNFINFFMFHILL